MPQDSLVVGKAQITGTYSSYGYPITGTYSSYGYPIHINVPTDDYANEIEVTQHDHDATLRFYRTRASSRVLVKEITIPAGLLDWLKEDS